MVGIYSRASGHESRRLNYNCAMAVELLFLGTGTSAGIPMIGCDCAVCRSSDPRDHRDRPSVLVSYPDPSAPGGKRRLLVDATAELRAAAIRYRIHHLDGVLITHAHADHIFGIDDLRRYNFICGSPIDLYADRTTHEALGQMFPYIFEPHKNVNQSFVPQLVRRELEPAVAVELFGATWTPLPLMHGRQPILGYRVDGPRVIGLADSHRGSLAYCTDVSSIPPETYPLLEDLDVLIIDALRYRHHPTHLTVEQALDQIEQIKPGRAYLTHIAHDIQHTDLEANLPEHVYLPFDGLTVRVGGERQSHQDPNAKSQ